MSLFISKGAMDVFLDRQIVNCHGYHGNKKEIYKEALLAVKSFAKTENCIEAEPVVHGHYVIDEDRNTSCSACGESGIDSSKNFCPNCGVKMDEVTK